MKKLLLATVLLAGLTAGAGEAAAKGKHKKHVCTEACKKEGKHVYAHGEKGHVCGPECGHAKK